MVTWEATTMRAVPTALRSPYISSIGSSVSAWAVRSDGVAVLGYYVHDSYGQPNYWWLRSPRSPIVLATRVL